MRPDNTWTVAKLKGWLRERGLRLSGRKWILVRRAQEAHDAERYAAERELRVQGRALLARFVAPDYEPPTPLDFLWEPGEVVEAWLPSYNGLIEKVDAKPGAHGQRLIRPEKQRHWEHLWTGREAYGTRAAATEARALSLHHRVCRLMIELEGMR